MVRADKTAAARDIPYVIISGAITKDVQGALDYLNYTTFTSASNVCKN